MGGACGDLVTAVIDSTGVELKDNGSVAIPKYRARLKKPHLFVDNDEKDNYILEFDETSISSHDYSYHVNRKHDIICVGIFDKSTALWAATRFKKFHRPEVWAEMSELCGAETIDDYADMYLHNTNMMSEHQHKIINLEDIIKGNLIPILKQYTDKSLDIDLYNRWKEKNQL
jgi:hypothetical protein